MAMASQVIAASFKEHLTELSTIRTNWTTEYADDLESRIDQAIETHLGIDSKKEQRDATKNLLNIIAPAKRDLSIFKTQVDEDFKSLPGKQKEILTTLGFIKNLRGVQKDNQEALIELLFAFKTNMTEELKTEITANGMNPVLIDNINGYADTVNSANINQETSKSSSKEITKEVVDVFNNMYNEIIGVCKIAADYYKYEPLKKEKFTFRKVVNNLNAHKSTLVTSE
jgi:uncharacterized protein YdiU (UPF0061 family)